MAVPILGKFIVLPVLLLLFYVSYGFRIRDPGQAGIEQHTCTHDSKCPDIDMTDQTTTASKTNRIDTGGVGGGRIKFSTGSLQKADGETKNIRWDNANEVKTFRYGKVRLGSKFDKLSLRDDGDDTDDEDDDILIESDDEFDGAIDEDNDETEEGVGDVIVDGNEDELREEEKSSKLHQKWGFRDGFRKDVELKMKGGTISRRTDEKKVINRIVDHGERTKNEKIRVQENEKDFYSKNENDGDKDDDIDVADLDIEIPSSVDESDEKVDTALIDKNLLPQRKLEKVRLENKDKIKTIVVPVVERAEKSRDVEQAGRGGKVIAKPISKSNSSISSTEPTKGVEKKPVFKEMAQKRKLKVEEHVDKVEESAAMDTKKMVKKKAVVSIQEVEGKTDKKSKVEMTAKAVDDESEEMTVMGNKKTMKKRQTETSISLNQLNDEILRLPNFVPNFTAVDNSICQQHGKIFLRQLRGYKLWALQMLDSSAKIPSGLLRGNVHQFGDYDQCLGISARVKVDERTVKVQGKYCLANIDIYASSPDMKVPVNLMQSRNFLRGTMHDTGHFVPKFTTINWALCLPAACSAKDAQITVTNVLSYLNNTSGLKFIVDVNSDRCYANQRTQNYSKETFGVLYFYAMIFCLVFVATLRDFFVDAEEKANYSERIIMSFSMRRTLKILLKPVRIDTDDINCIHGIRSLATIALYVAHKMIPIAGSPYSNRIVLTEASNNPLSCLLRVSIVYTDSFLILSGVLSAFNMSKESETRGEIRWFCRFVARFIRLTPALLVVIFWYAYVMEHIGSGPQWNIIKDNADLCKQNSWTNLLYIQNFFPFEEMCATHTHQLALDMQLSLLAPSLVYFLQVKPVIGILLMFFLLQVSATIRYFATTNNYLSVVIFHGMTAKHLYKTANLTYAVSIHRITPYLFGIGLGVLMHYTGRNVKIYRVFTIFGWIVASLLGSWAIFSPWAMARRDYVYDPEGNAHYAVLGPVSWALTLCWVIFACFTNHAGLINRFLSNYWLVIFSRISYSVYLTQFAVFFYNLATTRYSSEFQIHRVIDFYEIAAVICISTILTLFFDIPMQEVKSVLMDCTDVRAIKTDNIQSDLDDRVEQSVTTINHEHSEDGDLGRIQNKRNGEQNSSNAPEFYNGIEVGIRERKRSKSVQRTYIDRGVGLRRETTPSGHRDDNERTRRSLSKPVEDNLKQTTNSDEFCSSKRDRSQERRRERLGKLSHKLPVSMTSSGSEDEILQRRTISPRHAVERPRVSDEEDWEQELRIRRRRFMERMASEMNDSKSVKENSQDAILRRSSAEGKIALLTGTTERGMDAWTVSRGLRISMISGSSQERSDTEEESCLTGEYEQSDEECKVNSPSQLDVTEEENKYEVESENANNTSNVIADLGQSQEETSAEKPKRLSAHDVTHIASGKLFKRESIIKSQASEEDPEYLLPERPKLVEQEQEHPFKKAWQMQKSRSEEDGPSAFTIREVKSQQNDHMLMEKSSSPPISCGTLQPFQLVVEDVDFNSKLTYHAKENVDVKLDDLDGGECGTDDNDKNEGLVDSAISSMAKPTNEEEEEIRKDDTDPRDSDVSVQNDEAS